MSEFIEPTKPVRSPELVAIVAAFLVIGNMAAFGSTGTIKGHGSTPARVWAMSSNANPPDVGTALDVYGIRKLIEEGELRLDSEQQLRESKILRYGQYWDGLPVIGGGVVMRLNERGGMISLFNSTARLEDGNFAGKPIPENEAIGIAVEYMHIEQVRGAAVAELVVLPRNGQATKCWRVRIPAARPAHDWETYIGAYSGEVLFVEDRLARFDAAGFVFDPDPVTALHDPDLVDRDDAREAIPEEAYSVIELTGIMRDEEERFILTGPLVDTSPTDARAAMAEPEFLFTRDDDRFEEVMAYYHIDRRARYWIDLGFDDVPPSPLQVNVNGLGDDMSYFSPQTGVLTTGTGGVDDAEDADVLIHEYGHALIHCILPDWRGGETALLSEGWCDYQAGDYSLAIDDEFQPMLIYNWDGHNEFWDGRVLDADYTHPEIEGLDPHDAGQMWSSLLTEIRQAGNGRDYWNRIVLDHLYALGDSAMVEDAAASLLSSDDRVADGAFRNSIVQACEKREIFPPGAYSPIVNHTPLGDTENVDADRNVAMTITSNFGIDAGASGVIYRYEQGESDTIAIEGRGGGDEFTAVIPASGEAGMVDYYILAVDERGVFATDPPGAPAEMHSYRAGPDYTPPIVSQPVELPNTIFAHGETNFTVRVTDNIGVEEVNLLWRRGWMEPGGEIELSPTEIDPALYQGKFRWNAQDETVILYYVQAYDEAEARNVSYSHWNSFEIVRDAPIDGFELPLRRWKAKGWERTERAARSGDWSFNDRVEDEGELPETATAELDEQWDLSSFGRVTLTFWELHLFDAGHREYGALEVSTNEGESWEEMLRLTGRQAWWMRREVDLSDYGRGESPPIVLRFITRTPEDAEREQGWFIDEIRLSVGNFVSASEDRPILPERPELSPPFPNPTNSTVSLFYQQPAAGKLLLYDLNGRIVRTFSLLSGEGRLSIDLSGQSAGVYILKLSSTSEGETRTFRLVK